MKTIEWIMMGAFSGALILSLYKVYLFFPKTRLEDDDTTPEAVEKLQSILVQCVRLNPHLDEESLFQKIIEHPDFDSALFWRFNLNRLRHLIEDYRLKEPDFYLQP